MHSGQKWARRQVRARKSSTAKDTWTRLPSHCNIAGVRLNNNAKRIVIGTIVGAVVLFALGYLIFNVALEGFYEANMTSVPGVFHQSQIQWAVGVGSIATGVLLTLAILSRGGAPTVGGGAIVGAVVGFLVWVNADFVYYGLANVWTLTIVIVDPFVEAIHHAITGAVIAFVLARVSKTAG